MEKWQPLTLLADGSHFAQGVINMKADSFLPGQQKNHIQEHVGVITSLGRFLINMILYGSVSFLQWSDLVFEEEQGGYPKL